MWLYLDYEKRRKKKQKNEEDLDYSIYITLPSLAESCLNGFFLSFFFYFGWCLVFKMWGFSEPKLLYSVCQSVIHLFNS